MNFAHSLSFSLILASYTICPHTHHQNGVVERKHRHVVDLGLTLLSHASLPLKFWDHAFLTAVYLINRLPTMSLNQNIPYAVLFNQNPDYGCLGAFGCACFPLLRPYNPHKVDFRSHESLFLGYSTSHKGYKCLSPSGRIFISKTVLFNENKFPYHELFQPTSSPPSASVPSSSPSIITLNSPFQHSVPPLTEPPINSSSSTHPIPCQTAAEPISSNSAPSLSSGSASPASVPSMANTQHNSPTSQSFLLCLSS